MSWTQPICEDCWTARNPDRKPIPMTPAETETCSYCGAETNSGIYTRDDPASVPFPAPA